MLPRTPIFLYNGQLELSEIIKKQIVGADLAFLSACQTSTGDEMLSEEAVHLAGGMLAAGYRGVVATMWSIKDSFGPKFAEEFYKNLLSYEADKILIRKVECRWRCTRASLFHAADQKDA